MVLFLSLKYYAACSDVARVRLKVRLLLRYRTYCAQVAHVFMAAVGRHTDYGTLNTHATSMPGQSLHGSINMHRMPIRCTNLLKHAQYNQVPGQLTKV
jgi:hypothetical protein